MLLMLEILAVLTVYKGGGENIVSQDYKTLFLQIHEQIVYISQMFTSWLVVIIEGAVPLVQTTTVY